MVPHWVYILFLFALGACVGSFLNVVVWRLPRIQHAPDSGLWAGFWKSLDALSHPPSHCPKCQHKLAWFDNIPVFGWIMLGGKCRYCHEPISPRYPIVEAITGGLFVLYYVLFFVVPPVPPYACLPQSLAQDWPVFALDLFVISALLAGSLIDAELFIIPLEICYVLVVAGVGVHTLIDSPGLPGALSIGPVAAALSLGATLGLILSFILWQRGVIPTSFPQGEPLLEVDRLALAEEIEEARKAGRPEAQQVLPPGYSRRDIRREMRKEMAFLLPPMGLGILAVAVTLSGPLHQLWADLVRQTMFNGFLGSMLGAMVGAFVVWFFRIAGTLGFGRVAMGLGDVHLMFGVGACLGAGPATVAFFLAPFFGILIAIYMLLTGTRRELPYGPYLSLATGFVMIFYCPIAEWLGPGLQGLLYLLQSRVGS